ncbi:MULTISPECIES: phage tail protein [unclassified Pseudomonas]|uniref:TipJ family phage tail tip protein n=1 Tax=unclassified Pseudomonas TaxID=196821 RepID=UPI00131ABE42|nr:MULTISPECIES: phage tail protein [unclassified Pseudomonas]
MGKHHPISGAKGGSESAKSPTETPDSLISIAYAKVLDGISEGPIVGLVNGNQSIFLDKTPLANADGSINFSNVTVATRTGEADQDYVPGFPSVESETAVGVELKASQAWVQSISNLDLSAVRVRLQVPVLSNTDSKGNINGYEVQYAIDVATDSGAYIEVLASSFNGKTTTTYERSHRIELPAAKTGWRIRVRRVTADSTSSSIQSRTSIASYTEIIDAKLRYPYSAVVGITVDASQFSSIPSRAFHAKGRLIRVPSNYSPEARNYAGTWDGTFKLAWTDNPAWIYYDLLLNDRYGLGALITAAQVDRWGLYQIARYCDEMVDDGKGGKEPRFACNVYLQTRAEALQVLQDLASVFRGMAYWAAGSVMAVADMPSDPVYTYNQANVIDGAFTYAGSAKSTRFTVALVSWNDPANFYEKKVEYVSDQKGLARYGVQQTELTAFGCTSQGQAQRLGHYTLLTNRLENETVTFSVGLDGTIARPGQIIRVADEARAGRRIGGRISASTTTTVTLDSDATVAAGDTLVVILPTGVAETRKVKAYADRVVTVTQAFSTAPIAQSVFAIETTTLVPQTFRVLSVAEDFGQADLRYTITAVKHVAGKYAAIDSGAQIVTLPVTVIPTSVQAPPTGIQLSSFDAVEQGLSVSTLRATWVVPENAVSYDVWWRRDSNDWVYAGRCYTTSIEVRGIFAGTYLVRVAAINALNAASTWAYSDPTALTGKVGKPPALASLKTTSGPMTIRLDWAFPKEDAEDTAYTEIQQANNAQGNAAQSMGLFGYPTNTYTLNGLGPGAEQFFRGRLIDGIGNVGDWSSWTRGQASPEADIILEYLKGKITDSELGKDLLDTIDKIPDLQDQISKIRNTLEYDPTVANKAGDIVRADNKLWQALKDVPAKADGSNGPPNATYWANVGDLLQTAQAMASRLSTVEKRVTDVESSVKTVNQLVATFTPDYTGDDYTYTGDLGSYAGTLSIQSVLAAADAALALRTDQLEAKTGRSVAAIYDELAAKTTALTALATRTNSLEAKVGDGIGELSAQVSTVSKAVADLNGKANASVVTQVAITANGLRYVAGFALGLDYSGGQVTSQFLVQADRFGVLNGTDQAGISLPFVIENGVVVMNKAFIKQATITELLLTATLRSNAVNSNNQPLLEFNFAAGSFAMRGVTGNARREESNSSSLWYDGNGRLRLRISL